MNTLDAQPPHASPAPRSGIVPCLARVLAACVALLEGRSAPPLGIERDANGVQITFQGRLLVSPTPSGPWTVSSNATSPWRVATDGPGRFFRAESVAEAGGVFSSRTVVAWSVSGPFQKHFELALAGIPDGFFPPRREKPYFDARLTMSGVVVPVTMRVRGNSSLQECPFPKLKLKVAKEHRPGTPFAEAREIKVGTHCAEGGRGNIGRLRDERATYREALAYEAMDLLGFAGPRIRRARIEFRDTSPADGESPRGWVVERRAVLLDDIEVVGERLGGRPLSDVEIAALSDAGFDAGLVTDLQLLHALLGNWDYRLSADGRGLWNTDVLKLADGSLVPVAGDFDLASWVTGEVRSSAPRDYRPELGDVERQAMFEVEQIAGRVGAADWQSGRERFEARKTSLEALVATADVDAEGRALAVRHLAAFYAALDAIPPSPPPAGGFPESLPELPNQDRAAVRAADQP